MFFADQRHTGSNRPIFTMSLNRSKLCSFVTPVFKYQRIKIIVNPIVAKYMVTLFQPLRLDVWIVAGAMSLVMVLLLIFIQMKFNRQRGSLSNIFWADVDNTVKILYQFHFSQRALITKINRNVCVVICFIVAFIIQRHYKMFMMLNLSHGAVSEATDFNSLTKLRSLFRQQYNLDSFDEQSRYRIITQNTKYYGASYAMQKLPGIISLNRDIYTEHNRRNMREIISSTPGSIAISVGYFHRQQEYISQNNLIRATIKYIPTVLQLALSLTQQ